MANIFDADRRILADNIKYFGDPVYEYDLAQGIEDGYLAPPEIFSFDLFHDNKRIAERLDRIHREELKKKKVSDSVTGKQVDPETLKETYTQAEIDERLLMPDRIQEMSRHLFEQLIAHGGTPEQKTIVFCASDVHADRMAVEFNNLYQAWCGANGRESKASFAFKCTAKSGGGDYVADLRGSASSHFLACTVELLSTGVDVPCVRNLVFFQYIRSPIVFHQMLGRGTRIDPDTEKLMFRVYDYTDVTSLLGSAFKTRYKGTAPRRKPKPSADTPKVVEGVQIRIASTGRYLTAVIEGRHQKITLEEYRERIAGRLVIVAPDLAAFRRCWIHPTDRRQMLDHIVQGGFSPRALQFAEEAADFDLFDVLGEVGYGLHRLKRPERAFAFTYKHRPWLDAMPAPASATVRAIASQFGRAGTEALESREIFQTPEVRRAGGLAALKLFGDPPVLLEETKERIFAA